MRVTDEQLQAEKACNGISGGCPTACPFYGKDNCEDFLPNYFNIFEDLIEARDVIREMRKLLEETSSYSCDCLCSSCWEYESERDAILERTKVYK